MSEYDELRNWFYSLLNFVLVYAVVNSVFICYILFRLGVIPDCGV